MYDLMMIDDDMAIRNHLKSMIAFDRLPIRLVCETGDSETAQELFHVHRPKIIITDINIPIRSGLELSMEWSKIDPEIRFIVITGYSDISYVRESVSLGAVELLLKPLAAKDINESLEKAIAWFEKIRQEKLTALSMESLLTENLAILQRQYASLLLNPAISAEKTVLQNRLQLLGMKLNGPRFAVIYISLFPNESMPADVELTAIKIKAVSEETLQICGFNVFSYYDDSHILRCILSWNPGEETSAPEDCAGKICEKVSFLFGMELSAGIGIPVEQLTDLPLSASQAKSALESSHAYDSEAVVNFRNLKKTVSPDQEKILEQLRNLFRENDLSGFTRIINTAFESFIKDGQMEAACTFAYKYVSALLSDTAGNRPSADYLQEYAETMSQIFIADNMNDLKFRLLKLAKMLMEMLSCRQTERRNLLICAARKFISENLGNQKINLAMVSSHTGLSEVYFCRLFRKETGVSFSEYINKLRIETAKKLLADVQKRVSEICYEVGYDQPKYFNYVFKRLTGSTPLEYRRSLNLH
jgi:two-component system response regulator YesN